jgi:transposase
MKDTTIAVDLAKTVFEVAVSRRPGKVAERHRLSRGQFSRFLAERAPATVVMEACGTAHFWGREAEARGHRVQLLPPHAVRPYVLRNKTDGADAQGLLEAVRNEDIRPVPVKSVDQHVLAGLHRMRSTWLATRTARLNTVRGLLREFGFPIAVGARQVVPPRYGLLGGQRGAPTDRVPR